MPPKNYRVAPRTTAPSKDESTARQPSHKKEPLSIRAILTMILCFPVGLFTLWTNGRIPRPIKFTVTLIVFIIIGAILIPLTDPPERETGGIYLVDGEPADETHGPEAPADRQSIEIYAPRYTGIILEPTPSPVPIIVYCNNGGKYYHSEECRYVNKKTPTVTLQRAIQGGYTQCPDCNAPSPY